MVANEVKLLSTQTTRSTEEIRLQIDQVMQATAETVSATEAIQQLINEIDSAAAAISTVMQQQSGATEGIAKNVHETLSAVRDVNQAITSAASQIQNTRDNAESVRTLSMNVSDAVGFLGSAVIRIVKATAQSSLERRRKDRFQVNTAASVTGRKSGPVFVENISKGGALLATAPDIRQGENAVLTLNDVTIPFFVMASRGKGLHVKFVTEPSPQFDVMFKKLVAGKPRLKIEHSTAA